MKKSLPFVFFAGFLSLWIPQSLSSSLVKNFQGDQDIWKNNSFPINYKNNEIYKKVGNSQEVSYKWLDEDVLDIKNLKEATEKFISNDEEWVDEKDCPHVVRYFQELTKEDLPIILKWLKLKDLEYFGIASTDKSADIYLIYSWYLEMKENGADLEKKGLYKLIYLNAKATLHEMNFNKGDFPEEWLENHRAYHSQNFNYK